MWGRICKVLDGTAHGLGGVLHIRDGFIIHGSSQDEHDQHMRIHGVNGRNWNYMLNQEGQNWWVKRSNFFTIQFREGSTRPSPKRMKYPAQYGAVFSTIHARVFHFRQCFRSIRSLPDLIGLPQSWLLFDVLLNMDGQWFGTPPQQWPEHQQYRDMMLVVEN